MQIELTNKTTIKLISRLKETCDIEDDVELVEQALVLLGWGVAQRLKKRAVASIDEGGKEYCEISTPALDAAAKHAESAF